MPPKYPRKGLASYLIPFILILILIGTGAAIVYEKVDLNDVSRIFRAPEVAKDEKVNVVYQEGIVEHKSWSQQDWQSLEGADFLQVGDSLRVDSGSKLVLRFFEDSELRLGADTQIKLLRMDKDDVTGNHLAIELIAGEVWGRIQEASGSDGDFIINTNNQLIQMSEATLMNVSTNPETTRLLGGEIVVNVAEKVNGTRRPVARLDLIGGQQIVLDQLNIDQLKAQETDIQVPVDQGFLESDWYAWNIDKEEKLGELVAVAEPQVIDLEPLPEGLVAVTSHSDGDQVGGQVLLQGTYDSSAIEAIQVNTLEATLGLADEWEVTLPLNNGMNDIIITAQETDSTEQKEALRMRLEVDNSGPELGAVTQPVVDENGNGTLEGDSLELLGEVSEDATRVCVSHNDSTPAYCLQQFAAGDTSYRYLGGVSFGNVISGRNKYTIYAYDALENVSTKTVYLFKDEEKPNAPITEESPTPTSSSDTELSIPVITTPDPNTTFETTEETITLSGTVDAASQSLLVNGKKASYSAGSAEFSVDLALELGEQILKVQSVDAQGNKSKTATITVIYLEPLPDEEEEAAGTETTE